MVIIGASSEDGIVTIARTSVGTLFLIRNPTCIPLTVKRSSFTTAPAPHEQSKPIVVFTLAYGRISPASALLGSMSPSPRPLPPGEGE
jgi:hypothetical protein